MKRGDQKKQVKTILLEQGYIDNHWAIDTRLTTRLSEVIRKLRNEGMTIETVMDKETKNCRYVLVRPRATKVVYVEKDGVMHARLVQM